MVPLCPSVAFLYLCAYVDMPACRYLCRSRSRQTRLALPFIFIFIFALLYMCSTGVPQPCGVLGTDRLLGAVRHPSTNITATQRLTCFNSRPRKDRRTPRDSGRAILVGTNSRRFIRGSFTTAERAVLPWGRIVGKPCLARHERCSLSRFARLVPRSSADVGVLNA